MAPKVQGTRNGSIYRVPPSFLTAKTLQHCKHTGLNQAYFTRPLIINTFFASLPGVNFMRKKARVCEVLCHYFTQCVCTGHMGVGHSLSVYVTEYWKTDHVRTFGQLLFIGPANSHTHTLPVHCCINGLS